MKILALGWGCLMTTALVLGEPVVLEYHFQRGTIHTYQITKTLRKREEVTGRVGAPALSGTIQQQIVLDQRVDNVNEKGETSLTVTFRGYQARVEGRGFEKEPVDMEKDYLAWHAPLLNKSVTILVGKDGEVKKVMGWEALQKAAVDAQKNAIDKDAARQTFDAEYFAQLQLAVQPEVTLDALEVDQKWPYQDNVPMEYEAKQLVRVIYYRLAGVKEGTAQVQMEGKVTLQDAAGLLPNEVEDPKNPSILKLNLGDVKGEADFDLARGCFRALRQQTDLEFEASHAIPGQPGRRTRALINNQTVIEAVLVK